MSHDGKTGPRVDLDLDVNNYSAGDLLRLFSVSPSMTPAEMKRAYRTVLRTHPDKSGMDKKYFLFFSSAYKQLKAVYNIVRLQEREECARRAGGAEYSTESVGAEGERERERGRKRAAALRAEMTQEEFSAWFNRAFEEVRLYDPERDGGHGEWLRSAGKGGDRAPPASVRQMHEEFQRKKEESRALVRHRDYLDLRGSAAGGVAASSLVDPRQVRAAEKDYSGRSGDLVFTDVKKAYTEGVIPVTDADASEYMGRTVGGLEHERGRGVRVPTRAEGEARLAEIRRRENAHNVERAHAYTQEMERIRAAADVWNRNLALLT
jgi:curved DNA-binding protein CbpA